MPTERFRRALCALVLLGALDARAQSGSPYSQTVYNEGPGFRLADTPLVIHLGLAAEGGYDSNVFYLPFNEISSPMLRLRGHADLATLPPQAYEGDNSTADPKVDFRLSVQAEYREYLSSIEAVQEQRSVNTSAAADLVVLPRGPFTLHLGDTFVRTVDPRNQETRGNFTRDFNRASVLASYRLGGLELGLGDYFQINFWETTDIQFGNNMSDEGQAYARLRLLPQTQLSLVVRAAWVHYTNNSGIDSIPLRVMLGGTTLFTSWFGASVNVGYGNSFNRNGTAYNNVIGSLDLRFILPRATRISLGYDRDFFDSIFADYYVDDRVYAAFDMPVLARVSAHLGGGVRFRHYSGLIDPMLIGAAGYSSPTRDDRIYEVRAELSYRALDWLSFTLNYNLEGDSTDFAILLPTPSPVHFIKHSAFGRVDIAY